MAQSDGNFAVKVAKKTEETSELPDSSQYPLKGVGKLKSQ
jgi:hypothetical protein